ncbi:methyltransferase domain-containing protein [Mollicutes bacterium LVI A0039]|nr:methyltransferase domain-containing protein [Mollicutes bacterium LVI A0039]
MKITILSASPIDCQFENVIASKPILNDNSDVVIVKSDDYFDDKLFEWLRRLKKKYLAVFVLGFNNPELIMYNKQYVDFCFDNNINFLDYDDQSGDLATYLEQNLSFTANYTKFAKYYLELQPELDYDKWFRGIDFSDKSVVDLGCGMPTYLPRIMPREYLGLDLSIEMINRAQVNFPNYQFRAENITDAKFNCDVVISILDVFNYLPSIEAVKEVITNCYNNLNSGGILIFDIHTKDVLRTFKDYFDFEDTDDEQFIWESQVDNHKLTHYFQIIDKDYKVFVEKHYQTYYDVELLHKHLDRVGFTNISIEQHYNHHIITAYKKENDE